MKAASALATIIGIIKWGLMIVSLLAGGILLIGSSQGEMKYNPQTGTVEASNTSGLVLFLIVIGTAYSILVAYVLFGWLQHTLRMLINIAANTHPDSFKAGYTPVAIPTRQQPQQWSPAPPINTP